ncbi:extensin-like [Nymphaea colorata]|nr:extensin-like [Nymphaea colorata]
MITTLEKPRVTEIHVRMDCHGCVQKIKKAVHGLTGIYEQYIDLPQQKLTIVGWVDPQLVVKAIKKARKIATICSHTEFVEAKPETDPPPAETGAPATDGEPKPAEAAPAAPEPADPPPPADTAPAPSTESTPEPPPPPPEPEKPVSEAAPTTSESPAAPVTKEVTEDAQPIDYNSKEYGYGGPWYLYHGKCGTPQVAAYAYTYSYKPAVYVMPEPIHYRQAPYYTSYHRLEQYEDDYPGNPRRGDVGSIFSDENPNACSVM